MFPVTGWRIFPIILQQRKKFTHSGTKQSTMKTGFKNCRCLGKHPRRVPTVCTQNQLSYLLSLHSLHMRVVEFRHVCGELLSKGWQWVVTWRTTGWEWVPGLGDSHDVPSCDDATRMTGDFGIDGAEFDGFRCFTNDWCNWAEYWSCCGKGEHRTTVMYWVQQESEVGNPKWNMWTLVTL